ncbi:hypothetical protein QWJ34_04060 [Saccharibacillus sp. CPCC 101409]|uniref:hypothetical protein n=1 Tax=Saccharibacillus sp. CPCC 101409 TaxID=3058041 RepID=UPI0026722F96|nr:hypothetical protein [Saccharibacillus sp. CPCC 101409]MDO3408933.1 hypothetical protein [Saccharibacillus sp. CPCC 101409]
MFRLLLLNGHAYQTLITREMKEKTLSAAEAVEDTVRWLNMSGLPEGEHVRGVVSRYVQERASEGNIAIRQGGRFGKVLVRLNDQRMFGREDRV